MRGLYTASLLNTLSDRFGNQLDVGKGFDLIVGTSTGSILAAGLVAGIPLSQIINLYRENGAKIFGSPIPNNICLKFIWGLLHSCRPTNGNELLEHILRDVFNDETLGEVYKRRKIGLCIPSVNVSTHKARVFKTAHNPKKNADDNRKLSEVCLASSAAPIIFPIAEINDPHTHEAKSYFVDGGLWANNPVLISLIEALQMSNASQPIEIISIGTCPPPSGAALTSHETKRGLFGWNFGIKAIELSMDAQASGYQFIAQFLADHFITLEKQIDILRFDQSAPSSHQEKYLNLDGASEKSCNTLIQLGNADALEIHGRAISGRDQYKKLIPIFKSMSTLQRGKHTAVPS